jgi:diadenylate cyclase
VEFFWALQTFDLRALVDISILTLLIYGLTYMLRGTQAIVLVRGMIILFVVTVLISSLLDLQGVRWVVNNIIILLAIAIPVIFQPELRRIVERLGRGRVLGASAAPDDIRTRVIDEVVAAAVRLSERRHGALIVLQRDNDLIEYIRTGITLSADVTYQLLLTIFWPKTELHDGAAIIDRHGTLATAAAVLPLTASRNLPSPKMGTRHRAALGISEVSDALCVVVSEETGRISITNGGRMVQRLDAERLRTILNAFYGTDSKLSEPRWIRVRDSLTNVWSQISRNRGERDRLLDQGKRQS